VGIILLVHVSHFDRNHVDNGQPVAWLHTSPPKRNLMEFFDNKDNWGEATVKVGK
jgi:hypothetical protein